MEGQLPETEVPHQEDKNGQLERNQEGGKQ